MPDFADGGGERRQLESLLKADLRQLTSDGDQVMRSFAARNNMAANDLRALLFVITAETTGKRPTAGDLRRHMGLSAAAVTYTVERLTDSGHLVREVDPTDRRKVILRHADHGMDTAQAFNTRLARYTHRGLAELSDADLTAAHRAFVALIDAMTAFGAEFPAERHSVGRETS